MGNSRRIFETRTADNVAHASDGVAVTGANTYRSLKMAIDKYGMLGFEIRFTGTPTGTLTLWFSDLDQPDVTSDTDWIQDTTWAPVNPAGAAIKTKYTVSSLRGRWALVKYVNSASSGTIFGKEVN